MKATINGFEDVDKLFAELEEPQRFATKALEAAAPYLIEESEKAVQRAANKGYATGKLARSFVASKPKKNSYGNYVVVKPVGTDPDGHSYAARAAYLEYGTTLNGRQKNEPAPWRQAAVNAAEAKCTAAMEKVISDEVDRIAR
jgi:hypothetical protein